MFSRILIANRGEIACRVIRTARRLGIATVAVYSEADANALHVSMADEAVLIGGPAPQDSYLRGDKIIEVALATGAEAIHPGYGFLSENSKFCRACSDNGLVFIGPPPPAIDAMGSKSEAKRIMGDAGVPLLPGYHGDEQSPELLLAEAEKIGFPVLLKAAAGGGGKGMRLVESADEFDAGLSAAQRESENAFGDSHMLVEKFLRGPRHVEVQVFCDSHGNGVYLFERDCSVQRRHQKVIEEAPAPGMSEALREQMGQAGVRAATAIGYQGAGTVEFLLAENGEFYFMEMNTRLQVEHPVTEMITGEDLVEWQLRVASGLPLPKSQQDLAIKGHSFEARIYAEDAANDFLPVTGTLSYLQPPAEDRHVRIDSGVVQGDVISVHYDPMIAKLIVWDENRDRALARLCTALSQYRISGTTTNTEFLYNIAANPAFAEGGVDTGFIEKHSDELFSGDATEKSDYLPAIALYLLLSQKHRIQVQAQTTEDPWTPWAQADGWRLNALPQHTFNISLSGQEYVLLIEESSETSDDSYVVKFDDRRAIVRGELTGSALIANIDGHRRALTVVPHDGVFSLFSQSFACQFSEIAADLGVDDVTGGEGGLVAPMNGTVVSLLVEQDQEVEAGVPLLIMEAMKMEHTISAPHAGKVTEFYYQPGDLVEGGAALLVFDE